MKTYFLWKIFLSTVLVALILWQCTPTAQPTDIPPTAVPNTPIPPTAIPNTPIPPTAVPNTPVPSTPQVTVGLSSHSSTRTELSYSNPNAWFGPAVLPFGEGEYVKDPDTDIGVIFQQELQGDPTAMLATWGTQDIEITGLLSFKPESSSDAKAVVISRMELPTRIAEGGGITAQTVFIQRKQDIMQVLWYAPTAQWEELQTTFAKVLESVEIWEKYYEDGLMTMHLHDWTDPVAPWEGEGMWFQSPGGIQAGLVMIFGPVENPVDLLNSWTPEKFATALGISNCIKEDSGPRINALSGDYESRTGTCDGLFFQVSYLANRDRVIELVFYGPDSEMEFYRSVFGVMLAILTDIR